MLYTLEDSETHGDCDCERVLDTLVDVVALADRDASTYVELVLRTLPVQHTDCDAHAEAELVPQAETVLHTLADSDTHEETVLVLHELFVGDAHGDGECDRM